MSRQLVKWKRSEGGYTESHCGRFRIVPVIGWGPRANRASTRGFTLHRSGLAADPRGVIVPFSEDYGRFPTIKKAKAYAEKIAARLAERAQARAAADR